MSWIKHYYYKSFNAPVLQGPDLTNKVVGVLLRFREKPVALMADVKAMYHQLKVHPDDIDSGGVLETIPRLLRASGVQDLDMGSEILPVERALGVRWNVETDEFVSKMQLKRKPPTRRGLLSVVSSVHDPLGFISPFLLLAKTILQDLCQGKLKWDDVIPRDELWNNFQSSDATSLKSLVRLQTCKSTTFLMHLRSGMVLCPSFKGSSKLTAKLSS